MSEIRLTLKDDTVIHAVDVQKRIENGIGTLSVIVTLDAPSDGYPDVEYKYEDIKTIEYRSYESWARARLEAISAAQSEQSDSNVIPDNSHGYM